MRQAGAAGWGASAGASLGERIYRALHWSLIVGDLEPGTPLSTRRLAARHGVSQMPVREALKRLTAESAIEGADRRAHRVPEMEPARAAELFEVRAILEGAAAFDASTRLTDPQILRLARLSRAMDNAMIRDDARRYLAANFIFHSIINAGADNREMLAIVQTLYARTGPWLARAIKSIAPRHQWKNQHGAIIDAIRTRNSAKARDLVEADIRWNVEVYRDKLHTR